MAPDETAKARQDEMKRRVGDAALAYVPNDEIIGIGSGSTVMCFVDSLGGAVRDGRLRVPGAVAASDVTAARLASYGIPVVDLNSVERIGIYVDGADQVDPELVCIKGGGAAMTGERLVCSVSDQFLCLVDSTKLVPTLSGLAIPVEVLDEARASVTRAIARLGGTSVIRAGVLTDHKNPILDCSGLSQAPAWLESALNNIPGVVGHGLFVTERADVLLIAGAEGVEVQSHPRGS